MTGEIVPQVLLTAVHCCCALLLHSQVQSLKVLAVALPGVSEAVGQLVIRNRLVSVVQVCRGEGLLPLYLYVVDLTVFGHQVGLESASRDFDLAQNSLLGCNFCILSFEHEPLTLLELIQYRLPLGCHVIEVEWCTVVVISLLYVLVHIKLLRHELLRLECFVRVFEHFHLFIEVDQ